MQVSGRQWEQSKIKVQKNKKQKQSENITCAKLQSESPFEGVGVVWSSIKQNQYLMMSC